MTQSKHIYRLAGLTVASDRAIPGWLPCEGQAEVRVNEGAATFWAALSADETPEHVVFEGGGTGALVVRSALGGWWWAYPDGTEFWVSGDAREVIWKNPPHFTLTDVSSYLEGPILGFVARRRGLHVLHASGVVLSSGGAVLFTGPSGAGKSTMAAAALGIGRSLLTDDVAVVKADEDGFVVEPSHMRVRLWPEAEALLGNELPRISEAWEKRYLDFEDSLGEATRLRAIAVIEDGELLIEPLKAADSLIYVVGNVYLDYALSSPDRASDMDFFSRVIARVPVLRFRRPRTLNGAQDALRALEDFMESDDDG